MLVVTEPGEKTAATVAPLQQKTTYRIKVIALGPQGQLGSGSAERNFSTAATGQTYSNTAAKSVVLSLSCVAICVGTSCSRASEPGTDTL